jgi:Predicted methyltransferase regulatory domain
VLERNRQSHPDYLAHEFMNAARRPTFHADLVLALRAAKLEWVASAALLENFSPPMLHDDTRAVFDRFDEPLMQELVKDICIERGLRQDVFVRGTRRRPAATPRARWRLLRTPRQVEKPAVRPQSAQPI